MPNTIEDVRRLESEFKACRKIIYQKHGAAVPPGCGKCVSFPPGERTGFLKTAPVRGL